MNEQSTSRRGELGPFAKAFILLCTICGVAYGMIWGSPFGQISPPIVLALAIIVVIVAVFVIRRQKKAHYNAGQQERN